MCLRACISAVLGRSPARLTARTSPRLCARGAAWWRRTALSTLGTTRYGPPLKERCAEKVEEWKLKEKAAAAKEKAVAATVELRRLAGNAHAAAQAKMEELKASRGDATASSSASAAALEEGDAV